MQKKQKTKKNQNQIHRRPSTVCGSQTFPSRPHMNWYDKLYRIRVWENEDAVKNKAIFVYWLKSRHKLSNFCHLGLIIPWFRKFIELTLVNTNAKSIMCLDKVLSTTGSNLQEAFIVVCLPIWPTNRLEEPRASLVFTSWESEKTELVRLPTEGSITCMRLILCIRSSGVMKGGARTVNPSEIPHVQLRLRVV